MAKVLLVQPWLYGDEDRADVDMFSQWRNAPYALMHLATFLREHGHEARVADLSRDLVRHKGNVGTCLQSYKDGIIDFRPDIIGFGFFSVHFLEARKTVAAAKEACAAFQKRPLFLAGGIHASVDPRSAIIDIGCEYALRGEGEVGLLRLANGDSPDSIPGIVSADTVRPQSSPYGECIDNLDDLPFPDWSLVDYSFYAHPTNARMGNRLTSSLDVVMGRGCAFRCAFCAYGALSKLRFHSADYLVEAVRRISQDYHVQNIYFQDSTIGTNKKLLVEFCEKMISSRLSEKMEWLANIRTNQVDPALLQLLWRAGCRQLFYGFESGSQKILDAMNKKVTLEDNVKAAEAHKDLGFPYFASFIVGYPGEDEHDLLLTYDMIRKLKPPRVGLNRYVPLPGSTDFKTLLKDHAITIGNPEAWRLVGEVNSARNYSNIPDDRLNHIVSDMDTFVQGYTAASLATYKYQRTS